MRSALDVFLLFITTLCLTTIADLQRQNRQLEKEIDERQTTCTHELRLLESDVETAYAWCEEHDEDLHQQVDDVLDVCDRLREDANDCRWAMAAYRIGKDRDCETALLEMASDHRVCATALNTCELGHALLQAEIR